MHLLPSGEMQRERRNRSYYFRKSSPITDSEALIMETEQVAVQPTVGGITQAPQNVFIVNDRELKDFYLKFALFLNPDSCSVNRTEFEMLNILLKDLKKIVGALTHLTMHAWDDGMAEILLSCGAYSIQDDLNKKTRMQMNASMGKHLQFLTQMAMDSPTMKLLYRNMNKHYMQVEMLVKQMAAEIDRQKNKDGQQEILASIS